MLFAYCVDLLWLVRTCLVNEMWWWGDLDYGLVDRLWYRYVLAK